MKTTRYSCIALSINLFSFGVLAANPITSVQAEGMEKIGTISVNRAATLHDMETKLAEKAAVEGAGSYRVIYARMSNKVSGGAVIYK